MRAWGIAGMTVLALAGGCAEVGRTVAEASRPPEVAACGTEGSKADIGTAAGWRAYLAAHPDDVALVLDDGRGTVVEHAADRPQPLASAVKVVHLAAYARAVALGEVRTDEPVRLGEWERWYVPGTDGGAHPEALDRLGITRDGARAADPERTVPLDALVSSMIRYSDNAAPDLLRRRLGDEALRRAAADAGWPAADLPSLLGGALVLLGTDPVVGAPRAERAEAEDALARRHLADPAGADVLRRPLPPLERQSDWARGTAAGTARQLAALHRAMETGSFGDGAEVARRHLEWQPSSIPGVAAVGFKGGSLPGVLTEAINLRRPDGTVATAVLLVREMAVPDWERAVTGFAHQRMLLEALTDPSAARAMDCLGRGR